MSKITRKSIKVESTYKPYKGTSFMRLIRNFRKKNVLVALPFLLPNLVGFLLFICIPIIATLGLSLFNWSLIGTPKFTWFDNYIKLFTKDPVFLKVLLNTLILVFVYVFLDIIFALSFSIWLTQKIKNVIVFRAIMFLPVLVPPIAVAFIWQFIFSPEHGLLNYTLSLIGIEGPNWLGNSHIALFSLILVMLWQHIGYNTLIFMAGIQGISPQLYEAASIDGAGFFSKVRNITVPLLSPTIFFVIITTLIGTFQTFDLVFVMTNGGPGQATEILGLYIYNNAFVWYKLGYGSSVAVVMFAFILLITAFQLWFQRKWVHYE